MTLQMPLADVRGCTNMSHEVLLQIEWLLNIGDCRIALMSSEVSQVTPISANNNILSWHKVFNEC